MAYCTVDDLRLEIGGLTADNKKAPQEYLQSQIDQKTAHINSMIGRRYIIKPEITNENYPDAYQILKDICINLIKPEVSMRVSFATATLAQTPEEGTPSQAEMRLKKIRDSKYDLPGVPLCSSCTNFETGYYDNCEVDGIPRRELRNEARTEIRQDFPRTLK